MSIKIVLVALMFATFCVVPAMARKARVTETNDQAKSEKPVMAITDEPQKPVLDASALNSPDTVLVKVDDQPITQADLDEEMAQVRKMMIKRGAPPQQIDAMLSGIKPQVLEGLIVRKLLAKECEKEKITVSPEEIANEVETFKKSLAGKKVTLDDFLKQSGITKESFEKDVGEQLKIEKLMKVTAPTDEEIKAYYEKNKATYYQVPETVSARHILIATDATDDQAKKDAKKKKAEELRGQLEKGADFAKLAEANSSCPSKARGGNLGEFQRGQMVPAFEEVAFSLKTNEISKVVETDFGYHIIQTIEHNQPRTFPFEDVKDQIAFRLKGKKVQEKLETFLKSLKESAKIEYTKAGEALKPAPVPENSMPMMSAPEKETGKEKSSTDSSSGK